MVIGEWPLLNKSERSSQVFPPELQGQSQSFHPV